MLSSRLRQNSRMTQLLPLHTDCSPISKILLLSTHRLIKLNQWYHRTLKDSPHELRFSQWLISLSSPERSWGWSLILTKNVRWRIQFSLCGVKRTFGFHYKALLIKTGGLKELILTLDRNEIMQELKAKKVASQMTWRRKQGPLYRRWSRLWTKKRETEMFTSLWIKHVNKRYLKCFNSKAQKCFLNCGCVFFFSLSEGGAVFLFIYVLIWTCLL